MPPRKKKRSLDKEYACFPDEVWSGLKKSDAGTLVSSSASNDWLRCGDGFGGLSTRKASGSHEKIYLPSPVESFTSTDDDPSAESCKEDIVWSSSDSDLSDEESETMTLKRPTAKRRHAKIDLSCTKSVRLAEEKSSEDEEHQFIDWEKDSEPESEDGSGGRSQSEKAESTVQISDSESCPSSVPLTLADQERSPCKTIPTDISEYSSDTDKMQDEDLTQATGSRLGCVQKHMLIHGMDPGQSVGKSASDWLKSAQALLHTPEKQADKSTKTPEDSAKKRKRLLRGGLAERLNRLQNRERSAVSFWRHQDAADSKVPMGSKSGVLIVRILKVHEECSMLVALCEQLGILSLDNPLDEAPADTKLHVLFTKETAAQLKGGPRDIIHIYPPWQKLIVQNEIFPIVMNTHFSQKVSSGDKQEMKVRTLCPERQITKRKTVSLSRLFKLTDAEKSAQAAHHNLPTPALFVTHGSQDKHPPSSHMVSDSLLEVMETQGAAGWRNIHVRVVVQRVYCLPARDGGGCPLQGNPSISSPPVLNSAPTVIRLCILVQDIYGIFSELQLQSSCSAPEDTELHAKAWEGKSCCLTGMKILQRTTRGRAPGLFNLIDSLWPPLVPIKIHGQSQDKVTMKPSLPRPSFCYILAPHPDQESVDFAEDLEMSVLYLPPVVRSLTEILQGVGCSHRCSFYATVVYRRLQAKNTLPLGQCEFWLFVTDVELQCTDAGDLGRVPKILPVSVSPGCVLSSALTQALAGEAPCVVFFKDAVQENGRLICVERTLLTLQKPPLCAAAAAAVDLSGGAAGPVRLDELHSAMPTNALCVLLRGVVVGVNESTAISWPACNRCDNEKLEKSPQDWSSYYCRQCAQAVTAPVLKMQLEVFLQCPSTPRGTVRVKLRQKTISSLLGSPAYEDGSYELTNVLGMEVGPLNCYLLSAAAHSDSCPALEEVCLLGGGGE